MEVYNDHLGNTRVTYEPIIDPTDSTISYNLKGVFDYYPYGKMLRTYEAENEKYLTTQHQRDIETGFDYRGARFYDSDVVRFLSVDLLAEKFASLSGYMYVAGNPLMLIDPDGKEIVMAKPSEAETLVADLNRVYENKYGIKGAFKVVTKEVTVTKPNPDYGILDGINPFSEVPKTIEVTETRTTIEKNKDFDWSTDKYTKQMSEVIDTKVSIYVDIVYDKGRNAASIAFGSEDGLLKNYGGGFTVSSNTIYLSDALSETSTTDKSSNEDKWTFGAVALHVLLYHIHPQGKGEDNNPNKMRNHYNQKTGKKHGNGSRQNFNVISKYE